MVGAAAASKQLLSTISAGAAFKQLQLQSRRRKLRANATVASAAACRSARRSIPADANDDGRQLVAVCWRLLDATAAAAAAANAARRANAIERLSAVPRLWRAAAYTNC